MSLNFLFLWQFTMTFLQSTFSQKDKVDMELIKGRNEKQVLCKNEWNHGKRFSWVGLATEVPFPWGSALFMLLWFPVQLQQCLLLLTSKYFVKNVFSTLVLFCPFFWMSTDQIIGLDYTPILLPCTSRSSVKSQV